MSRINVCDKNNKIAVFPAQHANQKPRSATPITNVLLVSKELHCEHTLNEQLLDSGLSPNYKISNVCELYDALVLVEDNKYDLIIIDYTVAKQNTINFLSYISTATQNNVKADTIVLTEKQDHIDELERLRLLRHASKVTSKSATYFDMRTLLTKGSVRACAEKIRAEH